MRTLTLALALVACGTEGGDVDRQPELEAAIEGYESWGQSENWTGIQPGVSVHGAFVEIWVSDDALDTIEAGGGAPMPDGAALVKHVYADEAGETLESRAASYKIDGEWYWAKWDADGNLETSGQPSGCTGCHVDGQDYVWSENW